MRHILTVGQSSAAALDRPISTFIKSTVAFVVLTLVYCAAFILIDSSLSAASLSGGSRNINFEYRVF